MRFGIWKVRCLYRSGSLTAADRELARYKLDFVGVCRCEDHIKMDFSVSGM